MPKMACECGHLFDFSGDTTENELTLFQKTFIANTAELLDEGKLNGDDYFSSSVASGRDVNPCPKCGRIYIETRARSGVFDAYVKEDQRHEQSAE